ncbi:hypothetical protein RJ641_028874 [Dillenia turbinata]|uniref:Uncharacterized protein n=1 Tax=Dillenia turbinata TaxID=194707 RepID=A0AAN8W3L8_9MAGN
MEQKNSVCVAEAEQSCMFGDDELSVAGILENLPRLIVGSDSAHRFPFAWGSKRRRSTLDSNPALPSLVKYANHTREQVIDREEEEEEEGERGRERPINKVEASSPSTPLSFSPSESDDKLSNSWKKIFKKRKKEEWLKMIDDLTKRRELLKGEVENVRKFYDILKAENLLLKARREELNLCAKKETPYLETNKSLNLATQFNPQPLVKPLSLTSAVPEIPTPQKQKRQRQRRRQQQPQVSLFFHQQPLIINRTAFTPSSEMSNGFQYPFGRIPQQRSLPDLNVSAEENLGIEVAQSFDANRAAITAQARKRRLQIIQVNKMKNSGVSLKRVR